ncbi:MAG: response regulator [Candidatus Heimdallarchaeota archaeon]|nr:MAG: response regulator [Candidatus Heimdallarchaeota archaeon]
MDHPNGYNILLVDDDIEQAPFIKQILETSFSNRITVIWFENGVEALDFLDIKTSPPISLILLEIESTIYDGVSILEQLKDESSHHRIIPIIILSRSRDLRRIKGCFSLGANSCVKKPSDPKVLRNILGVVLEFWLTHAILPSSLT